VGVSSFGGDVSDFREQIEKHRWAAAHYAALPTQSACQGVAGGRDVEQAAALAHGSAQRAWEDCARYVPGRTERALRAEVKKAERASAHAAQADADYVACRAQIEAIKARHRRNPVVRGPSTLRRLHGDRNYRDAYWMPDTGVRPAVREKLVDRGYAMAHGGSMRATWKGLAATEHEAGPYVPTQTPHGYAIYVPGEGRFLSSYSLWVRLGKQGSPPRVQEGDIGYFPLWSDAVATAKLLANRKPRFRANPGLPVRNNHHIKPGGFFTTPSGRRGKTLGPARGGSYPVRWSDDRRGRVRDTWAAAYPEPGSETSRRNPRGSRGNLLGYLQIERDISPEGLRAAEIELRAAGVTVPSGDLRASLSQANAHQNAVTGMWTVPGAQPPHWGFDDLQDVLSRAGLRGPELWRAWQKVKGHLRVRWAAGNHTKPTAALVLRWAR
jgi:hypothetical protein